jgi:hypothetical protein
MILNDCGYLGYKNEKQEALLVGIGGFICNQLFQLALADGQDLSKVVKLQI